MPFEEAKHVICMLFGSSRHLENYLNKMSNDPKNIYDLKFLTESNQGYTAVFVRTK